MARGFLACAQTPAEVRHEERTTCTSSSASGRLGASAAHHAPYGARGVELFVVDAAPRRSASVAFIASADANGGRRGGRRTATRAVGKHNARRAGNGALARNGHIACRDSASYARWGNWGTARRAVTARVVMRRVFRVGRLIVRWQFCGVSVTRQLGIGRLRVRDVSRVAAVTCMNGWSSGRLNRRCSAVACGGQRHGRPHAHHQVEHEEQQRRDPTKITHEGILTRFLWRARQPARPPT